MSYYWFEHSQYNCLMGKIIAKFEAPYYFLTAFSAVVLWRIIFLWRKNINNFHQDEIVWYKESKLHTFFDYIGLPDSGYPTPLLRAFMWIASRTIIGNPFQIHLLSVMIVALCCSSILVLEGFNRRDLCVASIILGCFPSFDLLLWHNLSYYTFIPLMVVFLNGYSGTKNRFSMIAGVHLLVIFSCKPQLLASCISILFLLALRHLRQNHTLPLLQVGSSLVPLSLLIVGRQHQQSLHLQVGTKEFLVGIAALVILPISILVPALFVGFSGFLRIHSQFSLIFILQLILVASQNFVLAVNRVRLKQILRSERYQILLVSAVPIYISLFIFGNSTWGNDFFWRIRCTECLFQRHIFPLVLIVVFTILQKQNSRKFILLLSYLSQIMAIAIFAYSALLNHN